MRFNSRRGVLYCLAVSLIASVACPVCFAQLGGVGSASTAGQAGTTTAAPISRTIRGRVTNGLDGAAIPRALVALNSRSVLTDSQGRFTFPDFTDQQAYATLTKPGFSQTPDQPMGMARQRLPKLDATLELKMYPDATITGTVTGRDGLPLTHVQIILRRAVFFQNGWRWIPVNPTQTDLHGEYRFRQPAGRFQITLGYVARSQDTGEAVLPVSFPSNTSTNAMPYFEVASGQERRIDLRPTTGPVYPVHLTVDGHDTARGIQLTASTSSGERFQVPSSLQAGVGRVSLPLGTYTLQARIENRDVSMEGTTRVVVTGKPTDVAVIHMEPAAIVAVELAITSGSSSAAAQPSSIQDGSQTSTGQTVDLRQLNLRLHNLSESSLPGMQDATPRMNETKAYEFRLFPGRYRLEALAVGTWYVETAVSGVTNLISNDLVISSAGSGTPVRIVANNTQGAVTVTAPMPPDAENVYLYLVPRGPSLVPINPIPFGMSTDAGPVSASTRIPVGSYLAIATTRQIQDDLRNPDVLSRFSGGSKVIEVSTNGVTTVNVDIAQEKAP